MGLFLSYLLRPEKKPQPKPSNISLCSKGYGHYVEKAFNDEIYKNYVDHDWWIESEAYAKLLNDLGAVDFSGLQRGANVSNLIARVPKDMPANLGVRFPRHRGTLGRDDYAPLRFVRVGPELRHLFLWLLELGNSERYGNPGDYFKFLSSVVSAVVPIYDRDLFESTFGLVWIFSCHQD